MEYGFLFQGYLGWKKVKIVLLSNLDSANL